MIKYGGATAAAYSTLPPPPPRLSEAVPGFPPSSDFWRFPCHRSTRLQTSFPCNRKHRSDRLSRSAWPKCHPLLLDPSQLVRQFPERFDTRLRCGLRMPRSCPPRQECRRSVAFSACHLKAAINVPSGCLVTLITPFAAAAELPDLSPRPSEAPIRNCPSPTGIGVQELLLPMSANSHKRSPVSGLRNSPEITSAF